MNRSSDRSRVARALLSGTFVFALCVSSGASGQEAESSPAATDSAAAAPADQPRRGRDRRRDAETTPPAAEQTTAATAVADSGAVQPAEIVEAKLVCKNIKRIGTRVAQRVCGTPEQWAATAKRTSADAQEGFRQMRERSAIAGPIDNPLSTSD